MKSLSKITEIFSESVIREMTRICDQVGGYNLSQGFPDFEIPSAIEAAAIKAITTGQNQYPVTFGEPELRNAISQKAARYNNIQCDPKTDITVTCGGTEAMIATLKALINPGDEVIIFEPFYENYGPDTILSGATPKFVTLYGPDWHYSSAELAAVAALIGKLPTPEEYQTYVAQVDKTAVDTYRYLNFDQLSQYTEKADGVIFQTAV